MAPPKPGRPPAHGIARRPRCARGADLRLALVAACASATLLAGCGERDPLGRLARATPYALLEARLSGPFPALGCPLPGLPDPPLVCPFPEVGTSAFETLAEASSEIEDDPRDPRARRARALSELIWSAGGLGSITTAADALGEIATDHPDDPAALSDWAAAELTRSAVENRTHPNVLALEATERALAIEPLHGPARYNKALALDRLGFDELASRAWSAYLEVDPSSPWARSARERRTELREADSPAEWWPQRQREAVLDSLLPAWGEAILTKQEDRARRLLDQATLLAAGLEAASVRRAVADVERIWGASPPDTRRMALALRELGRGREHYRERRDSLAAPHLNTAVRGFGSLSPDLRDWATLWLGSTDLGLIRYQAVEERLAPLVARHDPGESPVLVGLARWLRGVAIGRRGQYAAALRHYEAGARAMSTSGEVGYIAFLWSLAAEAHTYLGNLPAAWEARLHSFEAFRRTDDPDLLRGALVLAVEDLRRSGLLHAALHLQNHAVEISGGGMAGNLMAEDLVRRAALLRELGRTTAAREDLVRAREAVRSLEDGPTRAWSRAEVWSAEGTLAARELEEGPSSGSGPPAAALALLDSAVEFHRSREQNHFLVDLHLERSRLHRRRGALDEARRELAASLSLVESTRAGIEDPSLGVQYAEASRGLWEAGLRLDLLARRDPWSGLQLMERIRRLNTPWLGVPTTDQLQRATALPEELAVLAYASLEDSLFVWVLHRSGNEALALGVPGTSLAEAARALTRRAGTARTPEEIRPAAERMGGLLLPDTVLSLIGDRDVAFVPDPLLAGLPFSALAVEGGWLLEERAVSVAPSLSLLFSRLEASETHVGRGAGRALVVADPSVGDEVAERYPPLPAVRDELGTLQALYPDAMVLQGPEAHPAAVVQGLQESVEILHFAGHAVSAAEAPGGSHLVLAPSPGHEGEGWDGGMLYAHALALQGFQGPEIVILTACSSVAPRPGSLGGFQGIALPFLERGTSAVVGTLWEVEDPGAARVASLFHRGWAEGLSAREALRRAQLEALRSGLVPARVWAAFQLVGLAGNPRTASVPVSATTPTETGGIDGV